MGKTWLVNEFAREFYTSFAYVNCEGNQRMQLLFDSKPDSIRLITALQIETGISISKEDTLVVLDNISSIKGFEAILSGLSDSAYSVIGISSSSYVDEGNWDCLNLHPLSFEEYLEARGLVDLSHLIGSRDWEFKAVFSSRYIDLMEEYLFVGGMPECALAFIETQDYSKVRRIQKRILTEYELSFISLMPGKSVSRIQALYRAVPSQLIKENNKFVYDQVRKGARAKEFSESLELLKRADIIGRVNRVTTPRPELMNYPSNTFKLYMNDVGLLGARLGTDQKDYLREDIFDAYNCALTQQFVWQQMTSAGVDVRYWAAYKGTSRVDFILEWDGDILPIEVVGEENTKAKNLRVYADKFKPKKSYRMSLSDFRNGGEVVNVPLYAAGVILDICSGDILVR